MARLDFADEPLRIASASVVGVLERLTKSKRYVFQVDLEWSDGRKSTSYRRYSDFFDFQCELLSAFRKEAGLQKDSERIIPYLPGKKVFGNNRDLALKRQPQLNEYVQKLIALPEHISRCEIVMDFFRSDWQEDRLRSHGTGSLRSLSLRRGTPSSATTASQYRVLDDSGINSVGFTNPVRLDSPNDIERALKESTEL